MLTIAIAVALGIIIAFFVLANLEFTLELVGCALVAGVLMVLLVVLAHLVSPLLLAWLLLVFVMVGWSVSACMAVLQTMEAILRPIGTTSGELVLTSFILSFLAGGIGVLAAMVICSCDKGPLILAAIAPMPISFAILLVAFMTDVVRFCRRWLTSR